MPYSTDTPLIFRGVSVSRETFYDSTDDRLIYHRPLPPYAMLCYKAVTPGRKGRSTMTKTPSIQEQFSHIIIDGQALSSAEVIAVARHGAQVTPGQQSIQRIQ